MDTSDTILTSPPPDFTLAENEKLFFAAAESASAFSFRATASLLSRIDPHNPADPIRRQIIPVMAELAVREYEQDDPLAEEKYTVAPGLVRRYEDRCIFKVTEACALHCRFCFRKGMLGAREGSREGAVGRPEIRQAARYLGEHPSIREVLLTGGDPLMLAPERLEEIFMAIRRERPDIAFRVGTRLPVALPGRITDALVRTLAGQAPLWLTVHCNHPAELSAPVTDALARLTAAGLRLGGQSVLLAGVNDDPETLAGLFRAQAEAGIEPYYFFHLDPAPGTAHFRVPLRRGLALMAELRARHPGLRLPVYALDLPEGGGKIPVEKITIEKKDGGVLLLRDPSGKTYSVPDQ